MSSKSNSSMNIDDNDSVQLAPEKLHLIFDSTIRSPIIGQGEHLSTICSFSFESPLTMPIVPGLGRTDTSGALLSSF